MVVYSIGIVHEQAHGGIMGETVWSGQGVGPSSTEG